jgi:hypothetical protein
MKNIALAALAYLCVAAFFGVVIRFVPHPDLVMAIFVVLALALYDVWTELRSRRSR